MAKASKHPDCKAITGRLEELGINKLSDDLGASVDEHTDGAVLHDNLQAYSPRKITVLTDDEMWALVDWWIDGYCPCGNEIPLGHYLCRDCMNEAVTNQGIRA